MRTGLRQTRRYRRFLVVLWLIFRPTPAQQAEGAGGINITVPDDKEQMIEGSKQKALERIRSKETQNRQLSTLGDNTFSLLDDGLKPVEQFPSDDPVQRAEAVNRAMQAQVQDFYRAPQPIRPIPIEVGYAKTVHILFPSPVTYIDIGSMDILAGKADGAENVVRVKAAVRDFAAETNLTVITEDGGFYTFDARYAENPAVSTLKILISDRATVTIGNEALSEGRVLLREVGREKPATVKRMLSDIYRQNRQGTKGIRTKKYGIEVEVRGIYVSNDVIYIHTLIRNETNISFEVDCRRFIVADRKLAKRTAQQQTPVDIIRVCNDPAIVRGRQQQWTVFALPKLTLPDDKVLLFEIVERNGARHQTIEIGAKLY